MRAILLASATATTLNGLRLFREDSTRGKQGSLYGFDRHSDRYLRRILVVGAQVCGVDSYRADTRSRREVSLAHADLLARKPFKVVAVALANKMARIAWALLVKGGPYRARALVAAA